MNEYQLNEVVIEVFKENVCGFRFLQKLSKNMGKKLTIKLE